MEEVKPLTSEDLLMILELVDLTKAKYINLELSKYSHEESQFPKWKTLIRSKYEMISFEKCTHEEIATIIYTTGYQPLKVYIKFTGGNNIKIDLLRRSVEFNGMEPCFTGPQIKELIGYSLCEIKITY
jgi:hypothetical protein